ncbi:fatty acid desaturase [Candidatus Methylospira mobilis]|uniref:DesA family fatty acid desaturase n=1 Tax=Candidatus Methylospira mobilis TaxID=1808979 RepID=UPI0028EB08AF|nr:fatty acid desaturase [Candidatus Methylospira mobilis]WNV03137.1 fatty acid desaturase [Candidatus Methylospira mobilis]
MILHGLIPLSFWPMLAVTLMLTHVTIVSVTIFLHRHQAHRALSLHASASHFFRFWIWLTTATVTKAWVAIHRKHHARCETPDDPHSPQVLGIGKVLFQGWMLYRREAGNSETLDRFGAGTPDDWLERHLYSRFPNLGIELMLILNLLLFGLAGVAIWAAQMLWIPFWAAGVVNGLGHSLGYRNFETPDASTNLWPIGIIIGGEELHNNHHAYPASARLSYQWWELDIGWMYIRLLALLNLAEVKNVSCKASIQADALNIDLDTVKAVLRNRAHILSLYGRRVVTPAMRQETAKYAGPERRLLRRIRPLLFREYVKADATVRQNFSRILDANQVLATVYQFKQQLKAVWSDSPDSRDERLQRLRIWCQQAQQSGIPWLQHFADILRGYRLQPVH